MASSSRPSCYNYSFHEIVDVTNNFDSILGKGGEGTVYKGMTKTNTSVAVKWLKPGLSSEFQKEITMLSDLDHPNIVSLVGYCQESDQFMSNGNLDQSLYGTSNSLSWMQRLKICIGAAHGLRYLHTRTNISPKGIIHRDVKPVNILLDDNLDAKIVDFGLSKMSHQHQANSEITTTIKGTTGYYAPEYQCYRKITRKIDVYAFGIVLSEVLCKKKPWDREESFYPSVNEKYGQWAKENIDPDLKGLIAPKCLEAFVNMLEKCLNMNPNMRPTMNDVVSGLEDAMKWQEAWQMHKSGGDFCMPGGEDRVILYCTSNSQSSIKLEPAMEKLKFPSDNFLKDFYIPDYILVPGSNVEVLHDVPSSPILVFINSKSGGQLGGDLLVTYRSLLNKNQVVDLGEVAPDRVLLQLYLTLESLKANGDEFALKIQQKLRIIVAGGDGTAGWLLGVVSDLKLSHPPPIATVPLGTGNNLPFAFGWGKKNPGTDRNAVLSFLEQVLKAKEMKIDSWHLLMRMKVPRNGPCDPLAPLELPHSLHAFHHVSSTDDLNKEGYDTFRGGFWNYFSMGMDSQVNQSTYAKLQGWFTASAFHPSSRNIAQLAKVKIMKRPGEWQDLHIPHSIRSIICLNLPSFSGGLNPWGTPNKNKTRDRDLTPPFVDDGLLEVVGFRDAWHGLVLIAPKGHGTRLAQAHRIRFEFHKAAADCTYMRIDGEPWKQPLPANDDTVVVEISHLGQVKMLATHDCRSKSVYDPSSPSSHGADEDDSDDEEEDSVAEGEEWRKFGAADTFRIPDEVDISHLS